MAIIVLPGTGPATALAFANTHAGVASSEGEGEGEVEDEGELHSKLVLMVARGTNLEAYAIPPASSR